jgi:hypothetical protein
VACHQKNIYRREEIHCKCNNIVAELFLPCELNFGGTVTLEKVRLSILIFVLESISIPNGCGRTSKSEPVEAEASLELVA